MKILILACTAFIYNLCMPLYAQLSKNDAGFDIFFKDSSNNINSRFEYLYIESNNYKEYKVISKKGYKTLQKNVNDSLDLLKKEIYDKDQNIERQYGEIENLKTHLTEINKKLEEVSRNKNSIKLFGVQLYKKSYNFIVFLIIFSLLALIGFIFYKFKNSFVLVKETQHQLVETQNEFEDYQKSTLKRHQGLNRKLQDEILKNEKKTKRATKKRS